MIMIQKDKRKRANRKLERVIIRIGGMWNICNGTLTLFFYSPYVRNNLFQNLNASTKGLNYLTENLSSFVMIYSFFFIVLGVLNLYLSTKLKETIAVKIPIWIVLVGMFSYLLVDIISALAYLSAGVLSLSKNKMYKLAVN
ncbi:hypothetical protein [Enterococcus phoeniculicola]|jgi:hypothetical protein|uniref:DNA phosphorothioation-dependent restriction protein DptG n=1 Tax=Enterococcus phoeniculicola ATCC BAA-412 TaxID=1158610 RepID=R3WLG5_9ENTE|nr:hypothetical protein [Enterococcus phoeniculicola]EOL42720.1 DNA phosphorothioation-dependent restriction protein DptG [Enterococcus phoeniculicola ATCC BAA-412]EOT78996.1 DNA phosphorothioation-dependent restriction protein DptG [Enterococcus phoeniculicola ATCC BAA-412]